MLNWKKKTITVRTRGDDVPVTGFSVGYFVVHKSLSNKSLWTVTHAPTGMALIQNMKSRKNAKELVESVSGNVFGFVYMSVDRIRENKVAIQKAINGYVETTSDNQNP